MTIAFCPTPSESVPHDGCRKGEGVTGSGRPYIEAMLPPLMFQSRHTRHDGFWMSEYVHPDHHSFIADGWEDYAYITRSWPEVSPQEGAAALSARTVRTSLPLLRTFVARWGC